MPLFIRKGPVAILPRCRLKTHHRRSQIDFTLRCMFPRYSDWDLTYTRKGLIKYRLLQSLAYLATFSTILGIVWSFRAGKAGSKVAIRSALTSIRNLVLASIDRIRSRI